MIDGDNAEEHAKNVSGKVSGLGAYCGARCEGREGGRVVSCRSQYRLWGVFPIVETVDDLAFTCIRPGLNDKFECKELRALHRNKLHGYTNHIFNKSGGGHGSKRDVLLVVATARSLTKAQHADALADLESRGVVGYVFGYFPLQSRRQWSPFNIVRVHVNNPYRTTSARARADVESEQPYSVGSWLLNALLTSLESQMVHKQQKRQLFKGSVCIDPDASCLRMEPGSSSEKMYERAGFDITRIPGEESHTTAVYTRGAGVAQSA
jgi:hypothetical protein